MQKRKSVGIKEKLNEVLELPKEVMLNVPKLTILGYKELLIENYKSIIEYSESKIKINTSVGMIILTGESMTIREISSEDVIVDGDIIKNVEFIR